MTLRSSVPDSCQANWEGVLGKRPSAPALQAGQEFGTELQTVTCTLIYYTSCFRRPKPGPNQAQTRPKLGPNMNYLGGVLFTKCFSTFLQTFDTRIKGPCSLLCPCFGTYTQQVCVGLQFGHGFNSRMPCCTVSWKHVSLYNIYWSCSPPAAEYALVVKYQFL